MTNTNKIFFALKFICSYAFAAQNQDGAFPLITADALHALAKETANQQVEAKEKSAETNIATEVQTSFIDEMLSLSTIDSSARDALVKKYSVFVQDSFLSSLKEIKKNKEIELLDQAYFRGNPTQREAIVDFLDHITKENHPAAMGFFRWLNKATARTGDFTFLQKRLDTFKLAPMRPSLL